MPDDQLEELGDDIELHGQREPVTLHEGRILDGRNRVVACTRKGVAPEWVAWDGVGSPVEFVISRNLRRRHLDVGQRAAIAVEAIKLFEAEAERRRLANLKRGTERPDETNLPSSGKGRSVEKASHATGVSVSSTKGFIRIKKNRPDLASRVVAGELTINAALAIMSKDDGAVVPEIADVQCDGLGNLLPDRLHVVFAARAEFASILNQLSSTKSRIAKLADSAGGEHIRFNTLQVDLDSVRNHLNIAMPFCLCCYCDGTDKACGGCRGTGWITEAIRDRAPKQET